MPLALTESSNSLLSHADLRPVKMPTTLCMWVIIGLLVAHWSQYHAGSLLGDWLEMDNPTPTPSVKRPAGPAGTSVQPSLPAALDFAGSLKSLLYTGWL